MTSSFLLHLSDLHLSPDEHDAVGDYKAKVIPAADRTTRRNLLESTLRALAEQLQQRDQRLAAVVVSGDVTYQNGAQGFAFFEQALANLGEQLPAPDHIIVVPGNHDVQWGTDPGSQDRYASFLEHVRAKGYVTPLLDGIDLREDRTRTSEIDPIFVADDDSFAVIAMNSANYCGVLEPLRGLDQRDLDHLAGLAEGDPALRLLQQELNRLRMADVARLSPAQLSAVGALLRDQQSRAARPFREGGPVRFVTLHHQLLPVTVAEEVKPFEAITNLGDVRDFLQANEIDVVLHGHKHVSHLYWDHCYDYSADAPGLREAGAGRPVLICSAGTIGGVGTELGKLIEVDTRFPHVRFVRVSRIPSMSPGRPMPANLHTDWVRLTRSQPVPADKVPTLLVGDTITDVYNELEERFDDGADRLRNVVCYVAKGDSALELPETYPEITGYSGAQRKVWFNDIVDWWQRGTSNLRSLRFTHGERIYRFAETIDQLANSVAALKADLGTGRAIISLFDPRVDHIHNHAVKFPAFCYLQFVTSISEARTALDCVAFFRSQEMRYWWPINMAEIARLQRHVIEQLGHQKIRLIPGAIITLTAIAYPGVTNPKAVIPLIDRIWQDDRNRLWSMAYELFRHEDGDEREARLKDWQLMFEDWLPGEQLAPGGVPVPLEGLEALRDAVSFFAEKHGSIEGERLARTLTFMIRENSDYLETELRTDIQGPGGERRDAHKRWRTRVREHAEDLDQTLKAMTAVDRDH